jgi:hypothetical protein
MNQLDIHALNQIQMHPNLMSQFQAQNNQATNKMSLPHQNYSFDEQQLLPHNNYYSDGINHRLNILQQAQSHSFNMDMNLPSSMSASPSSNQNQQIEYLQAQQQQIFQRNNAKRSTLRRAQRVDNSSEELNGQMVPPGADLNLMGLTPQQQLLLMRNQQYSNNSSGQESGLGTGSSNYTNATNSAHGTNDLLNNNRQNNQLNPNQSQHQQQLLQQQQQHMQQQQSIQDNLLPPTQPQIPRRKSLPSIVKTKSFKEDETAHSSAELNDKNVQSELYVIENGIRKRVTEKSNSALQQNKLGMNSNFNDKNTLIHENEYNPGGGVSGDPNSGGLDANNNKKHNYFRDFLDDEDQTPQLPRKIILESITSLDSPNSKYNTSSKRVSMPSIPAYLSPKFANKGTR